MASKPQIPQWLDVVKLIAQSWNSPMQMFLRGEQTPFQAVFQKSSFSHRVALLSMEAVECSLLCQQPGKERMEKARLL